MRFDLEVIFDVDGTYVPSSAPMRQSDGTWVPGDDAQCDIRVTWRGSDVTDLLNADELQMAEEAWIEYNDTLW